MDAMDAVCTVWSQPDSTHVDHFVGSGFFIGSGCLLTAAHVLYPPEKNGEAQKRWLRPHAGGQQSFEIREFLKHDDLDVALGLIETRPPDVPSFELLSLNGGDGKWPAGLSLVGAFEGRFEQPVPVTITAADDAERHYLFQPKQPNGHSGSALLHNGRVWGLAVRHYTDPNTHRGCAIAVHQFIDWLQKKVEGIKVVSDPALLPSSDLSQHWVERYRARLAEAFSATVFDKFDACFKRQTDGLPVRLHECFKSVPPERIGQSCVETVLALLKAAGEHLVNRGVQVTEDEKRSLELGFRQAMGASVRLCVNPGLTDALSKAGAFRELSVLTPTGAGCVLRDRPVDSLKPGPDESMGIASDPHTAEFALEAGGSADEAQDFLKTAFGLLFRALQVPKTIDAATTAKMAARARIEARDGRQRIIAVVQRSGDRRGELEKWVEGVTGLSLAILVPPGEDQARAFLFDEYELLMNVSDMLVQLRSPPWSIS